MLADLALLAVQLQPRSDRRSSSLSHFGLLDPVVEAQQHDDAERDAGQAAGQEQPLPAGQTVQRRSDS